MYRWQIPRNVWAILLSWGLAVALLSGMFALKLHLDRREAERDHTQQREAMCHLITTIIGDTEPPAGPVGERARQVRADLLAYRATLHCAR
jgi:hypothetical protein